MFRLGGIHAYRCHRPGRRGANCTQLIGRVGISIAPASNRSAILPPPDQSFGGILMLQMANYRVIARPTHQV
jgi:hypothetical protein